MSISLRIKELRVKNKLNQEDFADTIGINRPSLANIELGKQKPTLDQLTEIVTKYNTSYEWLIDGISRRESVEDDSDYISVPMYDAIAYGGDLRKAKSFDETITEIGRLKLSQQFKGASGAMFVRDDSMHPLYPNSCVVVFKAISDLSIIVFGRDYIIETDDYRLVKRILKAKNNESIIASSINTEVWQHGDYKGTPIYEAFELPKNKIIKLDLVLGKL